MGLISRAAFEVDDYWRIVEILHKRFGYVDAFVPKINEIFSILYCDCYKNRNYMHESDLVMGDLIHLGWFRLSRFDKKNWRGSYNALILFEHLLTHGPESVAEECQSDEKVIREMGSFQYIDEKGLVYHHFLYLWLFSIRFLYGVLQLYMLIDYFYLSIT